MVQKRTFLIAMTAYLALALPKFSLSSHVSTESLYGMKSDFFFFLLC